MKAGLRHILAGAGLALAATAAYAGGPIGICNQAPLKYSPSSVTLNIDPTPLNASHTKAQSDAIVTNAIALWNNVGTSTMHVSIGSPMPVDVTWTNFSTYDGVLTDGLSPVIYDSDGSIITNLFGASQVSYVIGFAGSGWYSAPTCRYAEGEAVMNGAISIPDTTMTVAMAHEFGHLIGLDHTQLDSSQGLAGANYPLMYPIAYRSSVSLGDDDISAISGLYPGATVGTTYGTLQGNFRLADGVTPVLGANIWAKENTTGKVYSVVSDYLTQSNGFFKMLLPPGIYTLHAQAIDTQFTGGSSVGPYANRSTDVSFQAPLYTGSTPMAPLTMGNSTPTQIAITASCTANADFRFNGTGSVTGNCGIVPPPPVSNARLVNLSTRMQVLTGNNVMIGGFIIGGSTNKTVAVVATGPSLAAYGITNPLANPTLTLVRSSDQAVIATNDDWQTDPNASLLQASGFAPTNAHEAALYVNLAPGAYTAIVSGVGGTTGVSVVAAYEVDHPESPLTNISTRGYVQGGNNVMIAGFIVQGTTPQNLAITATGPSLTAYGITNPLANPTLTIVRSSDQAVIAVNDNWQSDPSASQLQASGFAPSNPFESGLVLSLQPGAYTAIVSGSGGGTGTSVVGVFALP